MCPSCKVPSSSILYQFQAFTLFREPGLQKMLPCECMPSCQTWCSHPIFSRSNPHGFFWLHPVYVSQFVSASKLCYSGELTFPLILPTGLGLWDKVRVDLEEKKHHLSRLLPQAKSLKVLQGKKSCFPSPSDPEKWLLLAQNSEDSRISSFYPSKCSHPRSFFFNQGSCFSVETYHTCALSPVLFSSII